MSTKKWYIGERINPQFKKSYYKAYGQLTKKDASKKESPIYGEVIMGSYDSQVKYEQAIKDLRAKGFNVYE